MRTRQIYEMVEHRYALMGLCCNQIETVGEINEGIEDSLPRRPGEAPRAGGFKF